MRTYSLSWVVGSLALLLFIVHANGNKDLEDVEKFIQEEIDKTNVPVKRSTIRVIPEVTSFHDEADQQQQPSGKPDKISVTILKEYKVQGEDGNTKYVSIQDNDDEGVKSGMSPPEIQEFIQQEVAAASENNPAKFSQGTSYKIQKATDLNLDYATIQAVLPQMQSQQRENLQLLVEAPSSISPVPTTYKRKSMDGWIPLFTSSYIGPKQTALTKQFKDFYANNQISKGAYYSPHKDSIISESTNIPQTVASNPTSIQKAIPRLNYFTQSEVLEDGKGNLVNFNNDNGKMVIHAQNVIIKSSDLGSGIPNVSQIRAYGSTPQISALLRDRFLQNQESTSGRNNPFPPGGLALRSLAQAIRNGAFSLENDVIPSSDDQKPQEELEISIPHRFKMAPKIIGGYSSVSVNTPQVVGTQQATAASITEPVAYGVPAQQQQQQQQQGSGYGVPPRISANSFTPGLRDYGDGVKYALKGIQIVETQPAPGYGAPIGGGSLNELSLQLEQRLRKLIQLEVALQQQQALSQQQQQYGAPQSPSSQYGPPPASSNIESQPPSSDYGLPGLDQGQPLEAYGVPGLSQGEPLSDEYGPPDAGLDGGQEYGPPSDHSHSPPKAAKPFTLNLDFDTGFWGDPHANIEVDGGDAIVEHDHYGHGDEAHHEGPDIKKEVVEKIVTVGKNLFHSALDFSRVYNPITFLEKVKEFPPIRFEVYDQPKKGHHKKAPRQHHHHHHHHKKGKGKRHRGRGHKKGRGKRYRH